MGIRRVLFESWYGAPLLVGFFVLISDYTFHTYYTNPEETWTYFFAKFFWAFVAAEIIYHGIRRTLKGAMLGAFLFGVFTTAYYYYANYVESYFLTCCPNQSPQIQGFPSTVLFLIGTFNVTLSSFGFLVVHMTLFFIGYFVIVGISRHLSSRTARAQIL